jgi:hypothetical protein
MLFHVFIYGLFKDGVSISDYIESRMISGLERTWKEAVKESDHIPDEERIFSLVLV